MKLTTIRDIAVTIASATIIAGGAYAIRDHRKWEARQARANAEHEAFMATYPYPLKDSESAV
jgi:hypothetical protein